MVPLKDESETASSASDASKPATANANKSASGSSAGTGTGKGRTSEFGWYSRMLHDRFFGAWVQPTAVVTTGANMSALVRLHIESDGRVSMFKIVRSSGNVVVDESVAAVAKRVTHVDPPPAGLSAGRYQVNINFELKPE